MTRVLVIRHAVAMERDEFAPMGQPDSERPLTEAGRKEMRDVAKLLRRAVPELDVIATSLLVRARQTAEIVSQAYDDLAVETLPALSPEGSRADVLAWLREHVKERTALVGHAPSLDELVAWLVTGEPLPFLSLRKGGACLLSFDGQPDAGSAELRWLVTPKLLVRVAR